MDDAKQNKITCIPEISAIYFALLQCGYDYYSIERSRNHNGHIQSFIGTEDAPPFFYGIKQDTCEVYPYWPRAAILETASFYLSADHSRFQNYDAFRNRIMSVGNIAERERNQQLWDWIADFPASLSIVLSSDAFHHYLEWENHWIAEQSIPNRAELQSIGACLDVCVSKYGSPVKDISIVISPVKCVYSADYHLDRNRFIYSSGTLRVDSVIHEFLHHVVHPAVMEIADMVLADKRAYPGIDASYYLSDDDMGQLNAFEENAVRLLTENVLKGSYPDMLAGFLREIL